MEIGSALLPILRYPIAVGARRLTNTFTPALVLVLRRAAVRTSAARASAACKNATNAFTKLELYLALTRPSTASVLTCN